MVSPLRNTLPRFALFMTLFALIIIGCEDNDDSILPASLDPGTQINFNRTVEVDPATTVSEPEKERIPLQTSSIRSFEVLAAGNGVCIDGVVYGATSNSADSVCSLDNVWFNDNAVFSLSNGEEVRAYTQHSSPGASGTVQLYIEYLNKSGFYDTKTILQYDGDQFTSRYKNYFPFQEVTGIVQTGDDIYISGYAEEICCEIERPGPNPFNSNQGILISGRRYTSVVFRYSIVQKELIDTYRFHVNNDLGYTYSKDAIIGLRTDGINNVYALMMTNGNLVSVNQDTGEEELTGDDGFSVVKLNTNGRVSYASNIILTNSFGSDPLTLGEPIPSLFNVSPRGEVVAGFKRGDSYHIYKLNTSGNLVWLYTGTSGSFKHAGIDNSGRVYLTEGAELIIL